MTDQCPYCMKDASLDAFAIEIAPLSVSALYLFREQSHPGRIVVAYRDHVDDLADLNEADCAAFAADMARAARAMRAAFKPDKINYGAYADTMHHLHFHLVPKYRNDFEWGDIFAGNPKRTYLAEEKYKEMIAAIKAAL